MLEALADTVMPARVDLLRLSPLAELQHLVAGGTTLRLTPDSDALAAYVPRRLGFRWPSHIRAHPGRGLPVHDCQLVHGPADRLLIRTRTSTTDTEEPTW